MPAAWVLDASALIALLLGEPGAALVERHLQGACIGTVNVCETLTRVRHGAGSATRAWEMVAALRLELVAFDVDLARAAADLAPATSDLGLSLGDRACLALGRQRKLPVLTADRAWAKLRVGVEVRLIR